MNPFLAFNLPGGPELMIIFFLVLILFGAKRLPELARGLGQAVNEFRKAKDDFTKEIEKADPASVTPQVAPDRQPYAAAPVPVPPPAPAPVAAPAPSNNAH